MNGTSEITTLKLSLHARRSALATCQSGISLQLFGDIPTNRAFDISRFLRCGSALSIEIRLNQTHVTFAVNGLDL